MYVGTDVIPTYATDPFVYGVVPRDEARPMGDRLRWAAALQNLPKLPRGPELADTRCCWHGKASAKKGAAGADRGSEKSPVALDVLTMAC